MSEKKKTHKVCWAGRVQIYDILRLIFPFCHAKYRISMAVHLCVLCICICVLKCDYDDKYMRCDSIRVWVRGCV